MIYILLPSIGLLYFIKWVYELNQNGTKIYFSRNYYYKRYTMKNITIKNEQSIIDDIKIISMKSLNEIINYNFMKGHFQNHIIMLIYDKNNLPVAANISFCWKYKNINVMHLGLYLVDKCNQRMGLQSILGLVQMISSMIETNCNIYFTDLGRSATGFNALDSSVLLTCYPTLKKKNYNQRFAEVSKDIAHEFYKRFTFKFCCVSTNSEYDQERMVVKNSNEKEGGGFYSLTNHKETRKSKHSTYNDFVEELCPNELDEFIIVIKPSFNPFL